MSFIVTGGALGLDEGTVRMPAAAGGKDGAHPLALFSKTITVNLIGGFNTCGSSGATHGSAQ